MIFIIVKKNFFQWFPLAAFVIFILNATTINVAK